MFALLNYFLPLFVCVGGGGVRSLIGCLPFPGHLHLSYIP